ncbi:hypothetical protein OH76DRAFT_335469 [Lentinus brumalis]|uniref:Uncharacterized protein n=1 Tax=Lentinus brumalis TaxID=2498619 RepID=A0A371CJR0_9APHY|nr:hypothetical protein OH76DRAFT_335469 [Polyporus brumalis]
MEQATGYDAHESYETEGQKWSPSTISAFFLRPERALRSTARYPEIKSERQEAGVIPRGAVWHHDPLVTMARQLSRYRAYGAALPSQSNDGDGDEQQSSLGGQDCPSIPWTLGRAEGSQHSDAEDDLDPGPALLVSSKRSTVLDARALREPRALSLRGNSGRRRTSTERHRGGVASAAESSGD